MDKTEIKSGQKTKGERKRRRSTTLNNALGIQGEIFFLRRVVCYHLKLIPEQFCSI